MSTGLNRRRFLGFSAGGAAAVMLGTGWWDTASADTPKLSGHPFTLGVASGDPAHDSVVLWTRLAVDPLAADGKGGMPDATVPVQYQVAEDENFADVVKASVAFATPELGHSVHPEVHGLRPHRHYWYRFRVGNEISAAGRTRTAPAPGSMPDALRFAYASCANWAAGHYTAYGHLADEDLDLVVHLGDYIYEFGITTARGIRLPSHFATECADLTRYRLQYSLYKTDPNLQRAHAAFAWVNTFDDHEVEDGYAGDRSKPDTEPDQDPAVFLRRRAEAYQAMYENLPLRHTQMPAGPDIRIHRRISYGSLAEFTMLDTRQYRSDQPCEGSSTTCDGRFDPNATMLGAPQREWLLNGLATSSSRWQIIGNQVPMAQTDRNPDPAVTEVWGDPWDGYVVERDAVLSTAPADNLVVITGDRHSNYVMDLKTSYTDPGARVVGTEFVGTSITTGGNGADTLPVGDGYLVANPHMRFCNFQRGYSRVTVTPDQLSNDFRVVPYVNQPGAPVSTRATFVVENGNPGAHIDTV
ncbi:alkaline phosphatase D family protein [Nonomuraea sp. NPDC049784]|uniref:alkaline phosphatase D family protein n=1 Tax=Nonomuraea sp. NPDC049784 TaxID=3154361 RepID=UPI0033E3E3EA